MNPAIWTQPIHWPAPLHEDGLVRVVHVAGASDPQDVQRGIEILRKHHDHVLWDPCAPAPSHYLAASDAQRLAEWSHATRDTRIQAMICARGGYGTMRLLPHLAPIPTPSAIPWLVGYSDITALHLWLNAQGIASIHGPMVAGFHRYYDSEPGRHPVAALLELLRTRNAPAFQGLRTLHPGQATGRLIGGNLSMLQAMIGTPWLPTLRGAILLIEEVGEPAYRIDRMLQSLLLGDRAQGIAGIVFGDLTRCSGLDDKTTPDWLAHWTQSFGCPVSCGLPVGHGDRNQPLILGIDVILDSTHGTLTPLSLPPEPQNTGRESASYAIDCRPTAPSLGAGFIESPGVCPSSLYSLLTDMLDVGGCSALQLVVSENGECRHNISMGTTSVQPDAHITAVTATTRFDCASVSKAISTAILAHRLIADGVWQADDVLPRNIHPCGATLAQLLSHRSGLPAWKNMYDEARQQDDPHASFLQDLKTIARETAPNTQCVYSDIGYMLIGQWMEVVTGEPLDTLFHRHVATPLALTRTAYRRLSCLQDDLVNIAATEWCPFQQCTLQGIVHDEHTQLMDGVAGHAGLFSTATEIDRIAQSLLGFGVACLPQETVRTMWHKDSAWCNGAYTMGWDTTSVRSSNAGRWMTPDATVGHLGYTGTSLWVDTQRKIAITFLTNRVHPSRDRQWIRQFRPKVHDAVMNSLGYGPTNGRR